MEYQKDKEGKERRNIILKNQVTISGYSLMYTYSQRWCLALTPHRKKVGQEDACARYEYDWLFVTTL